MMYLRWQLPSPRFPRARARARSPECTPESRAFRARTTVSPDNWVTREKHYPLDQGSRSFWSDDRRDRRPSQLFSCCRCTPRQKTAGWKIIDHLWTRWLECFFIKCITNRMRFFDIKACEFFDAINSGFAASINFTFDWCRLPVPFQLLIYDIAVSFYRFFPACFFCRYLLIFIYSYSEMYNFLNIDSSFVMAPNIAYPGWMFSRL